MESKLKQQCQDSVGELPNLLLREGGYPHLPTTPIKQEQKADAWNDAGTKPDHPCLCETDNEDGFGIFFQWWSGEFWGVRCLSRFEAIAKSSIMSRLQSQKWREVQP